MTTIPRATLDRIREAVNLPALVQEYVTMRASAQQFLILCPAHEEKNPSCRVYSDHCWCYTCQWHGDAYRFLMLVTGCTFMEAATQLSERTGIPLEGKPATRIQRTYDAQEREFAEWWQRRTAERLAVRLSAYVRAGTDEEADGMLMGIGPDSHVVSEPNAIDAAGLIWRQVAGVKGDERLRLCLSAATAEERAEWQEWKRSKRETTEMIVELLVAAGPRDVSGLSRLDPAEFVRQHGTEAYQTALGV